VITFPDLGGAITIQAGVLSVDNISLENDEQPMYAVTFLPTNVSGGSETGPAYA
jgi:hypothetical protein